MTADEDKRIELYKQGLNDYEIAEKLHYSQPTIFGWRTRRGLKAHNEPFGNQKRRVDK